MANNDEVFDMMNAVGIEAENKMLDMGPDLIPVKTTYDPESEMKKFLRDLPEDQRNAVYDILNSLSREHEEQYDYFMQDTDWHGGLQDPMSGKTLRAWYEKNKQKSLEQIREILGPQFDEWLEGNKEWRSQAISKKFGQGNTPIDPKSYKIWHPDLTF